MGTLTVLETFFALQQLHKHDSWTRQQLANYQSRRLRALRDYAYQHSPFYQRFHKGLYDAPLNQLPILTKKEVMANFDELVTDRRIHLEDVRLSLKHNPDSPYLKRYWISGTSGSSGKPGVFLYNLQEWGYVMTSFARGQNLAGVTLNPFSSHRFGFILSPTSHHMTHRVGANMSSPWTQLLYLSALAPIEHTVGRLNEWQPEVLGSYASKVGQLAQEQMAHHLGIQPRWVFTSGELLTPDISQLIEQAWGVLPFNDYAATETAVVAAECKQHNGLHAYEDLLIIENVDDQNCLVPPGVYGAKLLVTVLFNRTQPLIRYELNDNVIMSEESCACGRPFARIVSIQGRQEETLYMPSLDGSLIPIHPLVFDRVMDLNEIGSWQIIQRNDGLHVLVTGLSSKTAQSQLEQSLRQALEAEGATSPCIFIERVEALKRTPSGKLALIKSECSLSSAISTASVNSKAN